MSTTSELPLPHRAARFLSQWGLRGAHVYWWIAEHLAPWPEHPSVELAAGVCLPIARGDWIAENIYRGLYERAELQVSATLLDEGDLAVDVGANVGLFTGVFSAAVGRSGRVVAFEPHAAAFAALRHLVETNELNNVVLQRAAAGSGRGNGVLTTPEGATHSGLASLQESLYRGDQERVEVLSLDDCQEIDGEIACLKIDVEGHEADVWQGARSIVAERRLRAAIVEVNPVLADQGYIETLARALGPDYSYFRIEEASRHAVLRRTRLVASSPQELAATSTWVNMLILREDAQSRVGEFRW